MLFQAIWEFTQLVYFGRIISKWDTFEDDNESEDDESDNE